MMANQYKSYGRIPIQWLSDNQTLPNATAADSTNMGFVDFSTNGALWINVYCNGSTAAVAVATAQTFSIEFQSFSADTAASAIPPFSTGNLGGYIAKAGATAESDAHCYLIHKTSADGALDFAAGDLMCEFGIPEQLMRALGHDYCQLVYDSDEDLATGVQTVDAFIYAKV